MDYTAIIGQTAYDRNHQKVGSIDDLYVDDDSGNPTWATIKSGLFGGKKHFAPLALASVTDDGVEFRTNSDTIADAPEVEVDDEISPDEHQALMQHYAADGLTDDNASASAADDDTDDTAAAAATAEEVDTITRSEEELNVGTRRQEMGTIRLRKFVVTENVTATVPLQHEEVRVVREPITGSDVDGQLVDDAEIGETEQSVTLMEEVPVIEKKVVPKEKVTLAKEIRTEEREINEQVRKEQVDVDDADAEKPAT